METSLENPSFTPPVPPISCYVNFGYDNASLRIKCKICELEKTSVDELEAHIAWDHMKWTPYQCGSCPAVSRPTDYTIRIHMQEVHPNEQQKTLYTPQEDKLRQLKNALQKSLTGNLLVQSVTANLQQNGDENNQSYQAVVSQISDRHAESVVASSPADSVGAVVDSAVYSHPTASFHPSNISPFPDIHFPLDNPAFRAQLPAAPGPTRQRKRQARHISQMSRSSTSDVTCALCDVIVSLDGLSHVNHVFQHVESTGLGARFTCVAERCNFAHSKKGLMEQHCKKEHGGDFSMLQDNTNSLMPEFEVMKSRCFPGIQQKPFLTSPFQQEHTASSDSVGARGTMACAKCSKTVRRELILRHVYEYHLSGKPLKCPYCPYATGYLLFNLRHHVSNCHSDKPMTIIDEREKYQPEVYRLRAECFPTVYQKIIPATLQNRHSVSGSSAGSSGMEEEASGSKTDATFPSDFVKHENGEFDP